MPKVLVVQFGILFGCLFPLIGQSQVGESTAEKYFARGEALFDLDNASEGTYDVAIAHYQKAIELLQDKAPKAYTLALCYQRIGSIYLNRNELQLAKQQYRKALSIKIGLNVADSSLYNEYVFLGNTYYYLSNYDSAGYYYDKAEEVVVSYGENLEDIERLYNSLGAFNFSLGNYRQAVIYYDKALLVMPQQGFDYVAAQVIFTLNIAVAFAKLEHHQEAIQRYKSVLKYQTYLPFLYQGLGNSYIALQEYDSASVYLWKAQQNPYSMLEMPINNSLGTLFLKTHQFDSAINYFQKTIKVNIDGVKGKNTYIASAYRSLGDIAIAQDNIWQALNYYHKALINTTFGFDETDVTKNPDNRHQAILPLKQFKVLQSKGNAFVKYYGQNQDTTNLLHALNCFQEAIRVARYTQKTYDNEEAKLFFVNQVHSLYEDAIRTAYHLYQLSGDNSYAELALQFSEKSKASVLTEILREVDIKTSGEVNDSLVSEEKLIKQQVTANRLKLVESSDSAQNEEYRQKINDLEIALARTIKQLQQDEKYYQLKYQEDTIDLAAWQSQLLNHEDLLLEYFMGEEQLYVFAIEQNALAMHQVTLDTAFRDTWKNVQNHLFAYDYGDKYQNQWSVQLYKKLIEPVAESLAQKKRLIVIPAGELSYLPFEMLAKDTQEDKFLLHDYTISYAFSGTLLYNAHLRETAQAKNQEVLAMAPFAGRNVGSVRDNSLSPLYFSRQEVASVGGSLYLEEEATKQLFLEIAGSYNILHLATHASVNDENPLQSFIAFYPEDKQSIVGHRLYTHELYNLRLDSVNLVVLSSCDAGNGRLVKGEGIISLARAFAYAGCPNIVTTLWKADDKAASDIASQMHYYLKKGYTKDEALRQAKLDYLRDPETKELRTPYYWANFVFIGDPAPIYRNYSWVWWLVAGLAVVLIAGAVITIKQRIRSSRQTA
ncbi:MAG: CHAT domain-containing protein [Tunicatimonas sp.]|uniref:CHAT domain-containing protein n=1 Tax=Tunicatimonas sp. TaxID=1940096 RepID=UPI003C709427